MREREKMRARAGWKMPDEKKIDPERCDHDATHASDTNEGAQECDQCGTQFFACQPCSRAGGAHAAVYHELPLCPEN